MSLINKMLTDLEARQNSSADRDPPGHIFRDLHSPAGTRKRIRPLIVVFLVCTMAIAVVGMFALDRWGFGEIAEWAVDWDKAAQQQVAQVVQIPTAERRRNGSGERAAEAVSPTVGAVSPERAASWVAAAATQHPAALVSLAKAAEAVSSRTAAEAANSSKAAVAVSERKSTAGKTVSKLATAMPHSKPEAKGATRNSAKTHARSETTSPASRLRPHATVKETHVRPPEKPVTQVSALSQTPPSPSTSDTRHGVVEKKVKSLTAEEQAENAYRNGLRRLRENRLSDAEMELRQSLESNPRQVEARELLAKLVVRRGRLSEAQKLLEEGRRLVPGHYRFAQLLARLYVQRGVDEKGLALLEQVQDDAQEDAGFLGLLAVLYQRAGRHQEAIENYTRAVILDPGQSQWWVALGISLEAEQRWGAAYSAYFRALGGQQLERNLVRYTKQRLALLRPRVANADTAKVPAVAARSEESHTAN